LGGRGQIANEEVSPIEATAVTEHNNAMAPLFGYRPDEADGIDVARAQEYRLLAALLSHPPDATLLACIAAIEGDSTPLGAAHAILASAAADAEVKQIEREFFDLFIGLGRGELLPYGSYYLTGFLNERPLARLREDLRLLGLERIEKQPEPEDHAALLCEVMAGLISREFDAPADTQQAFFDRHVELWIGRFFTDMERAESADFYRHVGIVGRLFIEIEREAFALPL
jgi:TorA maturation chaperone TorD